MTKNDKISASITVVLLIVGALAAWHDWPWLALAFGWTAGVFSGAFQIVGRQGGGGKGSPTES
jgi:hypothetical protein